MTYVTKTRYNGRNVLRMTIHSTCKFNFGEGKQVTKVTFPVKEQNVSVISTDGNGIIMMS